MDRVAVWCEASGMTERQLSLAAVRTPNVMRRARQRACITIKTMEAIEAFMVANPPCRTRSGGNARRRWSFAACRFTERTGSATTKAADLVIVPFY